MPEYISYCPTPVKVHHPGKAPVVTVCGRPLTSSMIHRNECPACKHPFRDDPERNHTQEMARRVKGNREYDGN